MATHNALGPSKGGLTYAQIGILYGRSRAADCRSRPKNGVKQGMGWNRPRDDLFRLRQHWQQPPCRAACSSLTRA